MADPTGARMRPVNAFFDSPRFPIKELPAGKGQNAGDGAAGTCSESVELPGWNAYVGAPAPPD